MSQSSGVSQPGSRRSSSSDLPAKTTNGSAENSINYSKGSSKYDIYSETNKPFGSSYRRSLHQLYPDKDEPSVKDTGQENGEETAERFMNLLLAENEANQQCSKVEIEAHVTCEIKEEKDEDKSKQNTPEQTNDLRESLMKEIRERRTEDEEKKTPNYYGYEKPECRDTFLEEEYSYEPKDDVTTSKVVAKSCSLTHIASNDEVDFKNTLNNTLSGSNKLKITTGPDGTFRYGSRKASVESNLLDDDSDITPPSEDFVKNSYVSSLKNAFDAIEDNARKESAKSDAFDGLRHYFQDNRQGLQELLVNNNVVIIEPFRHENKRSSLDLSENRNATCRITGATVKSQEPYDHSASNTLPRSTKSQKLLRNAFYHPIKPNRELVDSELPDPETVKQAREVFQRVTSSKATEIPCPRTKYNTINPRLRVTPEVRVITPSIQRIEKKKGKFYVEDKRYNQRRWTDTGSLSSGVSSDFSYEHDLELHHEESSNGLGSFSSEEEDYFQVYQERHPVSPEVLQKIRACGTSVTYYGGKVIAHSDGPIRSPMTMTIMDEIRRAADDRSQYMGVKFRLVKSNSCGSRLEIAGTEDDTSFKRESFIDSTISEEACESNEDSNDECLQDSKTIVEESDDAVEADQYKREPLQTWADVTLLETKKQWHCDPAAVCRTQDMEFETFEVRDESNQIKSDPAVGRG